MNANTLKNTLFVLGLAAMAILSAVVCAQEEAVAPAQEAAKTELPPGMTEEMMAKMQEYGAVNENHKVLENFVGSWDYTMKWWMATDSTAEESTGTSEVKSIMGGRFIEQAVSGTSMGQPFEGRGTTGYNNLTKEYTSIWIDNMGTGTLTSTASYDPAAKTLTETGSHTCPISPDGKRSFRAVTTIVDETAYTYEMYTNDEAGKEFKNMEITYKRK